MKNLTALIAAAALTACATQPQQPPQQWAKAGMTQDARQRDMAQCEYEAAASTAGMKTGSQSLFGQAMEEVAARRRLETLCLRAKGYALQ